MFIITVKEKPKTVVACLPVGEDLSRDEDRYAVPRTSSKIHGKKEPLEKAFGQAKHVMRRKI